MIWIEVLVTIGLVFLLAAFYLEHKKGMNKKHILFNLLNLIGSAILCIYAIYLNSRIFMVLEFVWAIAALYYLIKRK